MCHSLLFLILTKEIEIVELCIHTIASCIVVLSFFSSLFCFRLSYLKHRVFIIILLICFFFVTHMNWYSLLLPAKKKERSFLLLLLFLLSLFWWYIYMHTYFILLLPNCHLHRSNNKLRKNRDVLGIFFYVYLDLFRIVISLQKKNYIIIEVIKTKTLLSMINFS